MCHCFGSVFIQQDAFHGPTILISCRIQDYLRALTTQIPLVEQCEALYQLLGWFELSWFAIWWNSQICFCYVFSTFSLDFFASFLVWKGGGRCSSYKLLIMKWLCQAFPVSHVAMAKVLMLLAPSQMERWSSSKLRADFVCESCKEQVYQKPTTMEQSRS